MNRIQWVAVSVCFVLAVTLWFLVTLNKQSYTTSFDIPVKLTNFPNNYQLVSEFPSEMRIFASGPGIKLLYQDFDPVRDTVLIDFETFKDQGFFAAEGNLRLIGKSLKPGLNVVLAEPDTIQLKYVLKSNKKVPVKLDIEFDLPPSYRIPPDGLDYTDTVLVAGPVDSLAYVTECKTIHYKFPPSIEPQVVFVPLDSMGSLQMLPNAIRIRFTPKPYTEKEIHLPVHAIGVPVGVKINFDPDTVILKLLMPLEDFEAVQSGTIGIEVNYAEIDARSPYVVPHIIHKPADVELVSFSRKSCAT